MRIVLARDVGALLKSKGLTISVAESCTGGKLGDQLTDVSGSSDYFMGGVISYSNRAKVELLGVNAGTLAKRGAVNDVVAKQMASGVRRSLHTDIGVSITGIAGPSGGSAEKPVGLVYIAVSSTKGTVCVKSTFKGSRSQVKAQSVSKTLKMVKDFVSSKY